MTAFITNSHIVYRNTVEKLKKKNLISKIKSIKTSKNPFTRALQICCPKMYSLSSIWLEEIPVWFEYPWRVSVLIVPPHFHISKFINIFLFSLQKAAELSHYYHCRRTNFMDARNDRVWQLGYYWMRVL